MFLQNDSSRMLASKASPSIKKELEKQLQVEDDSNRCLSMSSGLDNLILDRQEIESFADYYAIIRTMEKLETQYIRGTIAPDVYEKVRDHFAEASSPFVIWNVGMSETPSSILYTQRVPPQ